ncbi:acyltransferase family protein [Paraburkholderia mimosarum]|uniref:acyltransferase family protein n=1 Tax=Paraburkholderia mimosarum TaxID=312026 RepID=UPI0039C30174
MTLLSNALSRERNNFDLVRLAAAMSVVYSHAFVVQIPDGNVDAAARLLGFDYAGSLGVFAFFLLSGMLVTASFERQASPWRFVALRAARIWPPVAVGSLFAVFVLGPLFTTLPLREYFAAWSTWANLNTVTTMFVWVPWKLPGVFEHNYVGNVICPSLWTLTVEVHYYFVVLLAGMLGLLKTRRGMLVAVLIGLIPFLMRPHLHPHFALAIRNLTEKPPGYAYFPELVFLAGMLLYAYRDHVVISGWAAIALWLVYLGLRDTPLAQPVFYAAFGYVILWLGATPRLHRFVPRNDYSLGIYIYGFPVQQSVASLWPQLDPLVTLPIIAPFVCALAWLSWHGVEKPAMNWVRRRLAAPGATDLANVPDTGLRSAP